MEIYRMRVVERKGYDMETAMMNVRAYREEDIPAMIQIWNEVVEEGVAFPQEDFLEERTGTAFFAEQSYCGVAQREDSGELLGLYILHPNNVGRCGHICNASYAVDTTFKENAKCKKLLAQNIQEIQNTMRRGNLFSYRRGYRRG